MNGTLGDYARIILGGTPKTSNKEFWDGDIPWVTPGDIGDPKHISSTARSITEAGLQRSNTKLLYPGDVVISARGTVGKVMECDRPMAFNQSCYAIRTLDEKVLHQKYVYYLIQECVNYLNQNAAGAVFNAIVISTLSRTPIKLPPLDNQKRIASILSAYDDLIENNRRRIQLLEQAAQLLYKEWFVHLRFPGHEHITITDGVPEGWKKSTVAEVCTAFKDGDWIESKDQGGEDFRLLQISNIGNNEFVETGNFRYITDETFRNLRCNEVVPYDILISRMPKPIGRAWYVYKQPWRMITAVDVTIARPNPNIVDPFYYLYHLNSPTHIAHCELRATGATRPRISRKNMGDLTILEPPMSLQRSFGEIASAMNAQRNALTRQNERLVKARDLLLPRLMNGEVAV